MGENVVRAIIIAAGSFLAVLLLYVAISAYRQKITELSDLPAQAPKAAAEAKEMTPEQLAARRAEAEKARAAARAYEQRD